MRGVTTYLQSMIVVGRAISTHTPHARRDLVIVSLFSNALRFQLTRLMRGVTYCRHHLLRGIYYFNSHASCEA